jgi:AcrR family transcriptional regulator
MAQKNLKTSAPAPQRASGEDRRRAILDAARQVFLERGYAETNIDAVVERVGASKATVYALFGNKDGLFNAVTTLCGTQFAAVVDGAEISPSPAENLRRLARTYCKAAFHPETLAMYRLAVGESGRRPDSGDVFYRLGPRVIIGAVAKFFRESAEKGVLETSDAEQLADCFLGALRGTLFNRAAMNPTRIPTQPELEQHIDFVVETFLHGVQPRRKTPGHRGR